METLPEFLLLRPPAGRRRRRRLLLLITTPPTAALYPCCYGLRADSSDHELRLQPLVVLYDAQVRFAEGDAIWIRESK